MLVFYQHTYDANVGPGDGSTPLVQSATSRAFALELSESFLHGDVMLAVRPVEYLSGLQASATGFDTERTAQPHYGTTALRHVQRHRAGSEVLAIPLLRIRIGGRCGFGRTVRSTGMDRASPVGRSGLRRAGDQEGTGGPASSRCRRRDAGREHERRHVGRITVARGRAGRQGGLRSELRGLSYANGTGGAGPSLHQVATTKTFAQTVDFIEHPSGGIMPKLYPGTLSEAQVKEVTAYVRATFH